MRTELSDGTITIRAYRPGIERAVFEAAQESIREIGPLMQTWRHGASYETAARHVAETIRAWQAGAWYDFAIARAGSPDFLGRVGLDELDANGTANVGYWVRTSQTGRGIATAAVRLVARFGFEDLGLRRLELRIAADNPASRRVAEKAGVTFEGVLPAGPPRHGERPNRSYLFSLTAASWYPSSAPARWCSAPAYTAGYTAGACAGRSPGTSSPTTATWSAGSPTARRFLSRGGTTTPSP
jgi:ribosomal-protein-serine acetyltransferase